MNYPQRAMLRIVGVILFLLALIFNIFIMPSSPNIRMADNICNVAGLFGGSGTECVKVHFLRLGVDYSWILFVVGAVLFFIGVWVGLGAKGKKEILG